MVNNPTECAITTFDNPFDPFEQFTSWDLFDKEKGYYSNNKVARLAHFTDDMTEQEMLIENERAIDLLISIDPTNSFKKVRRTDKNT
jgi:hypothetical protein